MASWTQQALIEAPVGEVWETLCDPMQAPEWAEDVVEVTGEPVKIEKGSTYLVTARGPPGLKGTTPHQELPEAGGGERSRQPPGRLQGVPRRPALVESSRER